MSLAVEEINLSSHLLPNVSLGYHIWDSPTDTLFLRGLFRLAPGQRESPHGAADWARKVFGVVGPYESVLAPLASHILSLYGLPQISYSIKDGNFDNSSQQSLLFRTVPSTAHQLDGIVALVRAFRWEWVSAVGSGTKATQKSVRILIDRAAAQGVCISYQGLMPGGPVSTLSQLRKVVENIKRAGTNVTIVLGNDATVQQFFQVVVALGITGKVWVATESWVLTDAVATLPGMERVGTVLGLTIRPIELPHVRRFVEEALSSGPPHGSSCPQSCFKCPPPSPESLTGLLDSTLWNWSFYSYAAVYAFAHALHRSLACSQEACPSSQEPQPWQLLEALHEVDFPLLNNTIKFSGQQDLFLGYDVMTWAWKDGGGGVDYVKIGSYMAQSLDINWTQIRWPGPEGQVPSSSCAKECAAGQSRSKQLLDECLCRCDDCVEGTYQNQTNSDDCLPCPNGTWSPPRSSRCFPPSVTFLRLSDSNVVALLAVASVGFLLLLGCLLVFAAHRHTPVVRAAGGGLAFIMLVALLASCAAAVLFVGQPSSRTCLIRQPIFALCFTACVSCLLVRSLQVVVIFKAAGRLHRGRQCWRRFQGPYLAVGLSCGVQATLCAAWLSLSPPALMQQASGPREVSLRCWEGPFLGLGAVLGYITLLAGACFLLAFWGRHLPENYSEARLLTASMLVFLMGWGAFLFMYATNGSQQTAALQMFTVQTSVYAVLCTFFLPRCYVILFRPERNTVAHFRTCIQAYTTTAADPETPRPGTQGV
ncbi:taste receptor type 1 member 1 [Anolis carolinensis]|uniref:taste receptor type 1 member 1 n=1 Tax=Anolis carolinensis TaxID=28377 RepID=UPI002F2B19F9